MARKRTGGLAAQLAPQARLEADVRYGPEESALLALADQAQGSYVQNVRAAKASEQGQQAGIRAARPEMAQGYLAGASLTDRGRSFTDPVVARVQGDGLGGALLASIARERQGNAAMFGQGMTDALEGLTERSLQASAGRSQAISAAGERRDSDIAKVQQRATDMSRERGSFEASRIGTLRTETLDRQHQRDVLEQRASSQRADRKIRRSSAAETRRHNQVTEANGAPGGKNGKPPRTGLGSLTQDQENNLRSELDNARAWAGRIMGGDAGKARTAVRILSTGAPASKQVKDDGSEVQTPAVPKVKHRAIVDAAVQIERDGHVSEVTVKELHKLGLHVPSKHRPPAPPRAPKTSEEKVARHLGRVLGAIFGG